MTVEAGATVALSQIGQIAVTVKDLDRAVAFYRDTLGMPFLFQVPNLAFFQCGGVRLMFGRPEKPEFDHPASIIYYKVDDIEATYASFKARGVTFVDEPHLIAKMPDHDLWMAFLHDSEDNMLGLMCEKRPPAPAT
jgi:catechol 2,3-dioxygenase-like lactoylglutathione lyase family enzyme